MGRSHAAHFVPFALPATERALGPIGRRASPYTEMYSAIPCRRTAPGFVSPCNGASVSFDSGDARIAGHGMAHDMLACRCDRPSPTAATATGRDKGFRVSREAQIFVRLAATHYFITALVDNFSTWANRPRPRKLARHRIAGFKARNTQLEVFRTGFTRFTRLQNPDNPVNSVEKKATDSTRPTRSNRRVLSEKCGWTKSTPPDLCSEDMKELPMICVLKRYLNSPCFVSFCLRYESRFGIMIA